MTGKSDALRKRLVSAGLSGEACSKYFETFRAFLSARLTKSRFEDEMLKVLPRDKVHVHNEIIQEIFLQAQQKRDGLRDLPIVTPLKDRRPAIPRRERPPSVKGQPPVKAENKPTKVGHKRPHDDTANGPVKPGTSDEPPSLHHPKKVKRNPAKKGTESCDRPKPPKPKPPEKPSPKIRRRIPENSPSLPPPSPVSNTTARIPQQKAAPPQSTEIATYDGLPYFPVRPGQAMDFELFLKLRQRMKRIVVEHVGLNGVKDDAVAMLLHGVEEHVKSLLDAGARQRAARDGIRPHRNLQCGPVRGYDLRESALRNSTLLGDEAGMELERLLMLL